MNFVTDFKPVPTRAALALQRKNETSDFQGLVFEDPSKSQHAGTDDSMKDHQSPNGSVKKRHKPKDEQEEFDIKKARNEVLRFAMNNQRIIKNKKKMEVFQLVKLGAKPPKKAYRNYKELLDERKRLKQIREQRKQFHQLGKNQVGVASVKCRSKTRLEKQQKKRAPVTAIDQNYGVARPKQKKNK